ncbi:hypothetical protein [Tateyamaria sp. syn59]|uniref:hypothetical protein n=1 Tax=Tateyamaria sp. syn59 TaxID=2576942 RepID=UPI0011BFA001|nr:hypothetical protein [Tateyamaria sp. syn59]
MTGRSTQCCGRSPEAKECALSDAGLDKIELVILDVARCYWQTFATPQAQTWLMALHRAEVAFGSEQGPQVALEVLAAVQAMRTTRISCFRFNNPACPHCAAILSEHERQFMFVAQAIRAGRLGPARTHAMLLCEGNDTTRFIQRMSSLADALKPDIATARGHGCTSELV